MSHKTNDKWKQNKANFKQDERPGAATLSMNKILQLGAKLGKEKQLARIMEVLNAELEKYEQNTTDRENMETLITQIEEAANRAHIIE
jgi:hypothetical protein